MIAAALLLVYALTASMRRRDPDETAGPMVATVMAGLCLALMIPMSIMSYRELRAIHGNLDSAIGFAGYLVFLTGVLMSFMGSIMVAKSLPSVPDRTWPHREF
jgi:drug/metabolite transporter (DMT)-like permease